MNETLQFVVQHGYFLVFAWVFVEQAGLPVPSAPLLLAAGALSGIHQMNLGVAIALAAIGALASDSIWYEIGRRRGVRVLQLLCRISLEPGRLRAFSAGLAGAGAVLGRAAAGSMLAAGEGGFVIAPICSRFCLMVFSRSDSSRFHSGICPLPSGSFVLSA